jgi:hypothetical protein
MSIPLFKNSRLVFAIFLTSLLPGCMKSDLKSDNNVLPTGDVKNATTATNSAAMQKAETPAEFIVDQSQLVQNFSYNIFLAPLGQEFTPTLHALDAVEVVVEDGSCSLVGSTGGDLRLVIRQGSIAGTIMGTSSAMHFVNCFHGAMRFDFPAFIPLTPGQTYVIEAQHVSGNSPVLYMNNNSSSYSGGRFILNGVAQAGKDLWFREGLYNFVARTKEQVKTIGWQNLVRSDGTTFKNQGDCMQYINTGR